MGGEFDGDSLECFYNLYDFTRCQRPDGTTYGTAGKCRKGVEITRLSTGYFRVDDQEGKRVGSIMAEQAFVGGGGIRQSGQTAKYTVSVQVPGEEKARTKGRLTLQAAKRLAKSWLGEEPSSSPAKPAGAITPRKLKNMKNKLEEVKDDLRTAMTNGTPAQQANIPSLYKKMLAIQEDIKRAEEQLKAE